MSSRRINLVMWTIVITISVIIGAHRLLPSSLPEWTTALDSLIPIIVVIVLFVMLGRAGVRSALGNRVSARTLIIFTLLGMGCSQVAGAIPILGLGGLFAVYGLPGLIALGLRKLSQRAKNPPSDQK